MISLVVSCSERKRAPIPAELCLRTVASGAPDERATRWWRRLERADSARFEALQLYGGEHWAQARGALAGLGSRGQFARLWVASAGYGLVSASARLLPYSATFTTGSPDCVLGVGGSRSERIEQLQAWWATLAGFSGPEPGAARSLHAVAVADPWGTLIVVAAPQYVGALRRDILAARGALRERERLIVISNQALLADTELADSVIPVDDRCRTVLGGTMLGLNARVACWLLANGTDRPLTAACLRERYDEMVRDTQRPPRHERAPMADEALRGVLRAALKSDPEAGWTKLLRAIRGDGRACEQGRFRELHRQVSSEIDRGDGTI